LVPWFIPPVAVTANAFTLRRPTTSEIRTAPFISTKFVLLAANVDPGKAVAYASCSR